MFLFMICDSDGGKTNHQTGPPSIAVSGDRLYVAEASLGGFCLIESSLVLRVRCARPSAKAVRGGIFEQPREEAVCIRKCDLSFGGTVESD